MWRQHLVLNDEEHHSDEASQPASLRDWRKITKLTARSNIPFGRARPNQRMLRRASHSEEIVVIRFRLKAARVNAKDGQ
jgi:hypothetical protein